MTISRNREELLSSVTSGLSNPDVLRALALRFSPPYSSQPVSAGSSSAEYSTKHRTPRSPNAGIPIAEQALAEPLYPGRSPFHMVANHVSASNDILSHIGAGSGPVDLGIAANEPDQHLGHHLL
jgi:hypothetical protein